MIIFDKTVSESARKAKLAQSQVYAESAQFISLLKGIIFHNMLLS